MENTVLSFLSAIAKGLYRLFLYKNAWLVFYGNLSYNQDSAIEMKQMGFTQKDKLSLETAVHQMNEIPLGGRKWVKFNT